MRTELLEISSNVGKPGPCVTTCTHFIDARHHGLKYCIAEALRIFRGLPLCRSIVGKKAKSKEKKEEKSNKVSSSVNTQSNTSLVV